MGRWSWSNRNTVEDCLSIDIFWLNQHKYLYGHRGGRLEWRNSRGYLTGTISVEVKIDDDDSNKNYIRFMYSRTSRFSDEKEDFDYKAGITKTRCNYGGFRYWFICPLVTNSQVCDRRVAKLYLPPGGKYFGCRHCYNLTYTSCKESHKFDNLFVLLAESIPGMTPEKVRYILKAMY